MKWKRLIFSVLTVVMSLVVTAGDVAVDTLAVDSVNDNYRRRLERLEQRWMRLCPSAVRFQLWGNMGLVSGGVTWSYGRNRQWETSVMFGLIEKHSSSSAKATFTLKQDFVPWSVDLGKGFTFKPLATGVYLNTVMNNRFWTHQPSRYPKGYYWFSTRVRTGIYVGERFSYKIPRAKRKLAREVSVFYELSTTDLMIVQRVRNDYITPGKMLTLSFGAQFAWR